MSFKKLPDARVHAASAMDDMADAHENQFHLCGLNRALAYAWRTLACECPDATDAHRDAQLNCEVEFDDEDGASANYGCPSFGSAWTPTRPRAAGPEPSRPTTKTLSKRGYAITKKKGAETIKETDGRARCFGSGVMATFTPAGK